MVFKKMHFSFMKTYLTKRQQRVRVNSQFSTWERIIFGVPQGSISMLGLLFFNIFLNDLFLFIENIRFNLEQLGTSKTNSKGRHWNTHKMVLRKYMVLNSGKCLFMCLGKNKENKAVIFNNAEMKNSSEEKLHWQ